MSGKIIDLSVLLDKVDLEVEQDAYNLLETIKRHELVSAYPELGDASKALSQSLESRIGLRKLVNKASPGVNEDSSEETNPE